MVLVMFALDILLMEQVSFVPPDAPDMEVAEGGEERMHSMVSSLLNDMAGLSMALNY